MPPDAPVTASSATADVSGAGAASDDEPPDAGEFRDDPEFQEVLRQGLISKGLPPEQVEAAILEYGNPSSSMRAFMEEISGSVRKIFSDAPPERPLVQLINWLTPADASAKALKCDISDAEECGKCVIFRHRASESLDTGAYPVVRLLHYKVSKGVCAIFELECVGDPHANYSVGEPVAEFGSWQAEALAEEKAKMAGGFRVGDRVVSLIDHVLCRSPARGVDRGDAGTAVGPSEDERAADHAERLCVDFGEGKGRANLLGSSQVVAEAEWPKRRKEDDAEARCVGAAGRRTTGPTKSGSRITRCSASQ